MPVMAALLIANVAMGIMTRCAPQFKRVLVWLSADITIGLSCCTS